jgi:hypothetical protein
MSEAPVPPYRRSADVLNSERPRRGSGKTTLQGAAAGGHCQCENWTRFATRRLSLKSAV